MVSVLLDLVRMLTPQFHVGCNEEQTSKRSDGVSLFPNGQLCAGAWEKFQERLPTEYLYFRAMAKIGYTQKPDGQNRVPLSTLVPGRHLVTP